MNKRSAEQSRGKVLAAAVQVFSEHGYDAASMRMISRAAGISVGGLYLYFENKTDLYLTILKEWLDSIQEHTLAALAQARDPREEITAFLTATFQYAQQHREMLLLQRRDTGCNLGTELKQQFFRARRTILADIVRRGVASGAFREGNPDEVARVIFNLIRGYVVTLTMDEDSLFSTEACVDLILNGLVRRNDG